MKIILSRKGFDSSYGGQPSPILPDNTLLSLPIPAKIDNIKFTDLKHNGCTYYDIIKQLKPKTKIKTGYNSHLDPDIRHETLKRHKNWKGLFGQVKSAQRHLENQGVKKGDLFLFFGWFKQTEFIGNTLRYVKNAPDVHVIFGYLQIGDIYKTNQFPEYAAYHPHVYRNNVKNNCIYEASEQLSFNRKKAGYGTFNYNPYLVLTKPGFTRSRWELPYFFKNVKISYHSNKSFKNDYFDSAKIGQEFVIEESNEITNWAMSLFDC